MLKSYKARWLNSFAPKIGIIKTLKINGWQQIIVSLH